MKSNAKPLQSENLPIRRPASEFLVERLEHEVLVYDQVDHSAHCLSPTAALVWNLCDGVTSTTAAAAALRDAGSSESVESTIAQLRAARLLASVVPAAVLRAARSTQRSRRALLTRGAIVAGAVLVSPVVFSIVAQSVAQAASVCGTLNNPCCQPGNTCKNPSLTCQGGLCQK